MNPRPAIRIAQGPRPGSEAPRAPARRRLELAIACSSLLALLHGGPARAADLLSPGELSRAHQALEGVSNCTRCHVAGQQLSQARCLECHVELKTRVAEGKGFHGRIPQAERGCQTCHHEHQGRGFALVTFGKEGTRGFDHARTGFVLRGKHRTVDCARCHDPRLADTAVKAMLEKQPSRKTFLGAPQACAACHTDEHRGQLGPDCGRCHGEETWRPLRGFDHARTAYPLTGRHAQVECARCHKALEAPVRPGAGMVPPLQPDRTVRWKGLAFAACTDCHTDPHQGRLGPGCAGCHTTEGWKRVVGAPMQRSFHDRTRYPLRGAHAQVRCQACHGPAGGEPAKYRGLAFERCTDCHADAHLGQIAAAAPRGSDRVAAPATAATCDRCHTVEGFLPARFEAEDHDRLQYPLEGAHRAVGCSLCHPKDPGLAARIPAGLKAELARKGRPLLVSLVRYAVPGSGDCRTCHRDPHAGQFEARLAGQGCTACHGLSSFRDVRFDHARDSRFPLTGKHQGAACGSCHRADAAGVVRYRPLPDTCAGCHSDPHAGQFADGKATTDCARCHETAGWKAPIRFTHAPPFTSFTLEGKHRSVSCARCHPAIAVGGGWVVRYRPLPTRCQGCHADFHKGAFRGFVP